MYDSKRDRGERISGGPRNFDGNYDADVSASGRYVAFASDSNDLVKHETDNGQAQYRDDIFVYDRKTEKTSWISRDAGKGGSRYALSPVISANGRFVAFTSNSNNLPVSQDLATKAYRVFVYDRKRKKTKLVSRTDEGGIPDLSAWEPSISANGRYVTYYSSATNLAGGQTDKESDIFRYDTRTQQTILVSLPVGGDGGTGGADGSFEPVISADGNLVAFSSRADDLVAGDDNGAGDVFVRDLDAGTTELVSSPVPAVPGGANGSAGDATISADGRYVAFASTASNLAAGDANGEYDVFRFDRDDGSLELVTMTAGGDAGNGESIDPALSADGSVIAFATKADDLAAEDGKRDDVLVRELAP
jgi:Tol biopolymer transport system component